ncbi:MAG: PAS domain S-box protein [Syntrophorhabdaceae bacterium]|nr:PAS domain S-box protein [Syntrophorhabdaceae bacterium]
MRKKPACVDLEQKIKALEEEAVKARRVQDALKKSEERFRNLFDNAVEGMYHTTLDGRLVDANMAFARMTGYESPQEAINDMTDLANQLYAVPDDIKKIVDLLMQKGYVDNLECRMHRRDGSIFWGGHQRPISLPRERRPLHLWICCRYHRTQAGGKSSQEK